MSALVPLAGAALGAAGAAAGPLLARFAAARAVAQPLALALGDEVTLLAGVLADVRRLAYLTSLSASDFAAAANGRVWTALLDAAAPELSGLGDDPAEDDCAAAGQLLADRSADLLADVTAALAAGVAPATDGARLAELLAQAQADAPDDAKVVEAGQAVLLTGTDRAKWGGAGLVLPTSTPDSVDPAVPPLQRVLITASKARRTATAAVTGLVAACVPWFVTAAPASFTGVAAVLAALAVLVLLVGSVVIALVDYDTMYIDMKAFVATCAGAWGLTLAADAAGGDLGRSLHGVAIVVGTAVMFETTVFVYKLVRGIVGQGFGDTLIILATAGVPPALVGDWMLGYYSVMAALVVAMIGWVVLRVRGKIERRTYFAFGPYLAAGWAVGWAVYLLVR